ncbi:hypothetical protein ACFUTX_10045 [Microbacterium sp. NPDC057407]|uniref:hypothetical protein n=1 Tax=Microbacterium sp. NPDC057407 TaxID=3346120 RepID=UPI00366FE6C1
MRLRRTGVWASAALALVLSGCAATPAAEEGEPVSPLEKYLGAVWGTDMSEEEQQEHFARQMREREELVAACMTEQGFDYIPETQAGQVGEGPSWEPDDRKWVAEYGYGYVNMPEDPGAEETYVDPNADYVESLPQSEQDAFYEALYGPQTADGSETDWSAGCSGQADAQMGDDPAQAEEFQPVYDALSEMYTEVESRKEIVDLNAKWAACMDDAGHPGYTAQGDASESIMKRSDELFAESSEGIPDESAMDELAKDEVELALVDLECREKVNYRDEFQRVQFAVEEEFIEDHKPMLDKMVAAAEQGRK